MEQLLSFTFVAQQSCVLTLRISQLLASQATKLLDRNHLYSSAISRSVTNVIGQLFVYMPKINFFYAF